MLANKRIVVIMIVATAKVKVAFPIWYFPIKSFSLVITTRGMKINSSKSPLRYWLKIFDAYLAVISPSFFVVAVQNNIGSVIEAPIIAST